MDKGKLLVVVDMQNDFINGPLGTPEALASVRKVCEKIDNWDGYVLFTMDTHYDEYPETVEGRHIPIAHCANGTRGWMLNDEIAARKNGSAFTVYKETFGSVAIPEIVSTLGVRQIQLVGLCTDICVISNAILLRNLAPSADITVDASCCAGTSPERHRMALEVMKQCCIDVVND